VWELILKFLSPVEILGRSFFLSLWRILGVKFKIPTQLETKCLLLKIASLQTLIIFLTTVSIYNVQIVSKMYRWIHGQI